MARFVGRFAISILLIPPLTWMFSSPEAGALVKPRIAIIYDSGGRGDSSINDAAALGIDAAKKKYKLSELDVREMVTDGTETDRENRLRFLAKARYGLIITVGKAFAPALSVVGVEYPLNQFAIIDDQSVALLNVTSAIFNENQGAFLAGALASLESRVGKVGIIPAPSNPVGLSNSNSQAKQRNYLAGAKYVNPKVKVFSGSQIGFTANDIELFARNAVDVVFSMWNSNNGVVLAISALNESNPIKSNAMKMKLIGLQPDQYSLNSLTAQQIFAGTVRKRYDVAVVNLFGIALDGRTYLDEIDPIEGVYGHKFTLSEGAIDIAYPKNSLAPSTAIRQRMSQIILLIRSGKIYLN